MIINFNLFLDLAPCVEIIFKISPMASQWPQSPWPLDGPIRLCSAYIKSRDPLLKLDFENISITREPYIGNSLSYLIFSCLSLLRQKKHQSKSQIVNLIILPTGFLEVIYVLHTNKIFLIIRNSDTRKVSMKLSPVPV